MSSYCSFKGNVRSSATTAANMRYTRYTRYQVRCWLWSWKCVLLREAVIGPPYEYY